MIRYYVWKLGVVMLAALPVYLLLLRPWRAWTKRKAVLAFFGLYMVGLLALALEGEYLSLGSMLSRAIERIHTGRGINLIPFRSIVSYFKYYSREGFLVNFLGNIVLFMPWGFGLVLLWKRKQRVLSVVLYSLALTLSIEIVQLLIERSVDIDDILLNFAGSCLGAAVYFLLRKKFPKMGELADARHETSWRQMSEIVSGNIHPTN